MTSNIEATFEILRTNGYMPSVVTVDGAQHVQVSGSKHDYLVTLDTTDRSTANDTRHYFRDASPSLAVVSMEARDSSLLSPSESDPRSPLAEKFAQALIATLAPADKFLRKYVRPLVRITPQTVHVIYRSDDASRMGLFDSTDHRLFEHGLHAPDMGTYDALELAVARISVPTDGGSWLNDRSPLNTPRAELPLWDADAITPKVCALVDRFVAAGELRVRGAYVPPRKVYENDHDGHAEHLERAGIKIIPATDDRFGEFHGSLTEGRGRFG